MALEEADMRYYEDDEEQTPKDILHHEPDPYYRWVFYVTLYAAGLYLLFIFLSSLWKG
jgi:hypothetical protein